MGTSAVAYGAEICELGSQAKNKQAASQTKIESSRPRVYVTYRDRKTNIWVRKKAKVADVIELVRRWKWNLAGQVSGI